MYLDAGLRCSAAQLSTAGRKPINEDSLGMLIPEGHTVITKGVVAVIADGVSAAEAGKEAAETCVRGFLQDYFSTPDSWSVKRSAHQVISALNRWLYSQGSHFAKAEKGYISTLSIAIVKSRTAHLFHVGDSRIYRFRGGVLEPLSRDHARHIGENQSYLTRAMGLDVSLEVDYRSVDVEQGDLFLLSTDGLHGVLSSTAIAGLLGQAGDNLDACCARLVDAALEAGSDDNISCQLLRLDALPGEDADEVYRRLTALPFPPELSVGDRLDGLEVIAEIHASARSQIYKVKDIASGHLLAMKTPSANFQDDPAYLERFVMESWIGRRIASPHVVEVVEREAAPSCLYYLTEYIDGQTLAQWIKTHPDASPREVVAIAEQVARGLLAMHRRDTLHQDIKPENILLRPDGSACIIDFGSCYVAGLAEISSPIPREYCLGTAHYSAPEQVLMRPVTARADQFALAVVVFEMLTGKQPFAGKLAECASAVAYRRLHYVPASQVNPHVPLWLDAALEKGMSISPELRYADVAEFVHDLRYPNPAFSLRRKQPLVARNPLRFWQAVSAVLFILLMLSLFD
ncbi:protein kinase [Spongiibacter taiwanensis]|uniref:bifunctional protein-serine/threonine kinase/phosphatase n=1 Tax=Spongiibacter taiwanensis TaxID=1748242 RepID=UPI0020353A05|nr:bifunctional protein-serine/threonine kinase/phosphatase [Spongiibacter taiwanensis]USA44396.1 protein kinase [Spongiibacter taiwanensis]